MKFDQDFIEKVRDANNIVELISAYSDLKPSGGHRWMGLCPFPDHREKTPSFSVSEDRQLYHCFGCKKSGNIFTFLEQYNGLTFPDAVKFLAERASIALPEESEPTPEQKKSQSKKEMALRINKFASQFYHQQLLRLPQDHPYWKYIRARGLSDEVIQQFRIGVSLNKWDSLSEELRRKRAPLPVADELGLIRPRKQGSGYYDIFRERLIFPILSPMGQVFGFGGRSLSEEMQPKYLNSPESLVFHKGRTLYGLNEAAKYIRSKGEAIIVEGYMDQIAMFRAGFTNTLATLGTALTPEHGKLLRRYTDRVVVLFDGDAAGRAAAEKSLPILLKSSILPRAVFLPDNLDPDEYIEKFGLEAMEQQIQEAPELFIKLLNEWLMGFSGSAGDRVRLLEKVEPTLAEIEDSRLRDLYILEVAHRLDVAPDWLRRELRAAAKRKSDSKNWQVGTPSPKAVPASRAPVATPTSPSGAVVQDRENTSHINKISLRKAPSEEILCFSLALKGVKLLEYLKNNGILEWVSHSGVRTALELVLERYGQKPEEFDKLGAFIASQIDQPELISAYMSAAPAELTEADEARLFEDCMAKMKSRYLRTQAKQILQELRESPDEENLERIVNIHRDRLALKNRD